LDPKIKTSIWILSKFLNTKIICLLPIGIVFFYSKDARLPVQLQRAMAAEAEAAREARAKV